MIEEADLSTPGIADWFDELTLWSSRFGALLLDDLELQPVPPILDVGCGTGLPLLELASIHGREGSLHGTRHLA